MIVLAWCVNTFVIPDACLIVLRFQVLPAFQIHPVFALNA